jgi:branched-chain amino acid transport system substrate-binding protein
MHVTRRMFVGGLAAASVATRAWAQSGDPIPLGSLVPLSGFGSAFGPEIVKGQQIAIAEVMAAGGLLGRPVKLLVQDDQSSPEPAVRAAQQLIQVDKVPVIMGPWVSAVASAVAPLCWQNKVMLLCIGSADSITALPHEGYIARTQPSTTAYDNKVGSYAKSLGVKSLFVMAPQTPYTATTIELLTKYGDANGIKVGSLVYDGTKTSYREEAQTMLASKPDMLFLGGYVTDNIVLNKDLYRVGFKGHRLALATGITPQFVEAVGATVAEGLTSIEPIADSRSTAYAKLEKAISGTPGVYLCEGYDEANLAMLSMGLAKTVSGTAIRDSIRHIGDPAGTVVDNAVDGLRLIAQGKPINYLGASSSCKFAPNGDIMDPRFRINVIHDGKIETSQIL